MENAAVRERVLQKADRARGSDVDAEVENLSRDRRGQQIEMGREPEIAIVNRDRLVARQVLDVEFGLTAAADAELGLAAGIGGIVDVAAFLGEHALDGGAKFGGVIHAGSLSSGRFMRTV